MIRFYAEVEQKLTKAGCWEQQIVKIYDRENEFKKKLFGKEKVRKSIGTYRYGYSSGSANIFQPFEQDGQWYATYADDDYTNLKIMTLPDCKFYCSVDTWYQFCPIDVYIPMFIRRNYKNDITSDMYAKHFESGVCDRDWHWLNEDKTDSKVVSEDEDLHDIRDHLEDDTDIYKNFDFYNQEHLDAVTKIHTGRLEWEKDVTLDKPQYYKLVFVTGCVWGGPYEIRCIDVSDLKNKKGAKLDYLCVCDDDGRNNTMHKIALRDRIRMRWNGAFSIIHDEYKEIEELKKEAEEWKARRND